MINLKKSTTGKHLAQYKTIQSLMLHMQTNDPTGNYEITTEGTNVRGRRRFVSLYVAPSATQANSKMFTKVATVDAAHLTSPTGGQLCALTAYDANLHIMPLCFGVFRTESEDNWGRFMARVFRDYPHFKCLISDGSKGGNLCCFTLL